MNSLFVGSGSCNLFGLSLLLSFPPWDILLLLILLLMANVSTWYTSYGDKIDLGPSKPNSSLLEKKKNLMNSNLNKTCILSPG